MNTLEKIKLLNHYYGTFSRVCYDKSDSNKLYKWAKSNVSGDLVKPEDYHTTIYYSKIEGEPEIGRWFNYPLEVDVDFVRLALYGDNMDVLVLEVYSEAIDQVKKDFNDQTKPLEKFPCYSPHITLAYNFTGNIEEYKDLLPDFKIKATEVKTTPNEK